MIGPDAERLAKGSGRHTGKESLAENDGAPSYLAAAGDREYEHEKKSREAGSWG